MPDYKLATRRAARKFGVDPSLLEALVQQESGFNPNAKSPAGAQGIAQFMPGTAPSYGVNLHDNRVTDDLEGAAKYIAANLKRTGGNVQQALSIYNSGRPDGYKSIPETANYVKTILAGAKQFGGATPTDSTPAASATPKTITTSTTPGVDRSPQRAALISSFLHEKGSDPVSFAMGIRGLQDTPGKTTTTTSKASASVAGTGTPKGRSKLLELFWQGQGGVDVKNGQKVPQGFVTGHQDHVHVAAGPKTVVELGKLAQSMGLRVGENPAFNGGKSVTSGHAPNSYHYKGQAIDVSGDPKQMAAYAKRVASSYGIK